MGTPQSFVVGEMPRFISRKTLLLVVLHHFISPNPTNCKHWLPSSESKIVSQTTFSAKRVLEEGGVFKDGTFLFSFFIIFVFSIVQLVENILPMSGFEPQISGVGSNCSTKWATTTALSSRGRNNRPTPAIVPSFVKQTLYFLPFSSKFNNSLNLFNFFSMRRAISLRPLRCALDKQPSFFSAKFFPEDAKK